MSKVSYVQRTLGALLVPHPVEMNVMMMVSIHSCHHLLDGYSDMRLTWYIKEVKNKYSLYLSSILTLRYSILSQSKTVSRNIPRK